MQDRPDREELLAAVAEFLMNEVKPAITDARLSFRVLIAANLAQVVAQELRSEDAHDDGELERLRALLPDVAVEPHTVTDGKSRRAALAALNRVLSARLRSGEKSAFGLDAAREHLTATLRDKLSVNNPFFDLRPEID